MSTPELPSGVWPAALTPFDDGLAIDTGAFERHIRHLASVRHVSAIVVNGHAGEATSLSAAEQRELIGRAKAVTGRDAVIVAKLCFSPDQRLPGRFDCGRAVACRAEQS